ncbi:MAG: glycosyltransferase [Vicinamibacterales bacterium]
MRVLHVLSALDPQGASAVSRLIVDQRTAGHVVAAASMRAFGEEGEGGAGVCQFVERTLGGAAGFDIIHAHGTDAAPVTLALDPMNPMRTPVIVTLHDWVHTEGTRAARVDGDAVARADLVTAPSALAASLVTSLGVDGSRVRVIPYPVDATPALTSSDGPLEREIVAWRKRGGDILCAVSHAPSGGHAESVLTALHYLSHRDALLCVMAGPLDVSACARTARSLGLVGQVRFQHPARARALAARCDYVVLPAFDQRRPFALAEAWCDGVPVLAGRHPQFAGMDVQGHGTIFFDSADPSDLARAIATVRDTTAASRRLLVERGRTQYRSHFAPEAVYAAYMDAYAALAPQALSAAAVSLPAPAPRG